MFGPVLNEYILNLQDSFDEIPNERRDQLKSISEYIYRKINARERILLTFICTHNSRRSHFGQIWAQTAAEYYGIGNVKCFSGGTEATAFNPAAVKALKKTGLNIILKEKNGINPVYSVYYADNSQPIECFSKVYNHPANPQYSFAAIMTCSDADEACPTVFGADARFSLPYEDPKSSDGTPEEETTYDIRCKQVCREMLYLFDTAKQLTVP